MTQALRLFFFICAILLQYPGWAAAQPLFAPTQDPLTGSRVFGEKGCSKCHAIFGVGGTSGPDLARLPRARSFYDLAALSKALAERRKSTPDNKELTDAITGLEKQIAELADGTATAPGFGLINRDLARYLIMIESGDMRPAQSARANANVACESLRTKLARWRVLNSDKLPALNKLLQQNNLDAVPMIQPPADPLCVPEPMVLRGRSRQVGIGTHPD